MEVSNEWKPKEVKEIQKMLEQDVNSHYICIICSIIIIIIIIIIMGLESVSASEDVIGDLKFLYSHKCTEIPWRSINYRDMPDIHMLWGYLQIDSYTSAARHMLRTNMLCKWDEKSFICTNRRWIEGSIYRDWYRSVASL